MTMPEEIRRLFADVSAVPPYTGGPVDLGGDEDDLLPPGAQVVTDPATGLLFVAIWDDDHLNADGTYGGYTYSLAPQWLQKAAGVIGGGTGAGLSALEQAALQQDMELRASQEQRATEMHPLEMQELGLGMELAEQQESRAALSDQFTRAQANFSAAFLADQLAASKREQAVSALSSMVEFMVPPGMDYWPGMEPGGPTAQILGQAGLNYTPTPLEPVAQVDFSQFTQGLSPETDAALRYLRQMQQQNMGVM